MQEIVNQLSSHQFRKRLPLNDSPHQECQNPGFEQEPPQTLRLSEIMKNLFDLTKFEYGRKLQEAKLYQNQQGQFHDVK